MQWRLEGFVPVQVRDVNKFTEPLRHSQLVQLDARLYNVQAAVVDCVLPDTATERLDSITCW
jgi:hypothetical protein